MARPRRPIPIMHIEKLSAKQRVANDNVMKAKETTHEYFLKSLRKLAKKRLIANEHPVIIEVHKPEFADVPIPFPSMKREILKVETIARIMNASIQRPTIHGFHPTRSAIPLSCPLALSSSSLSAFSSFSGLNSGRQNH